MSPQSIFLTLTFICLVELISGDFSSSVKDELWDRLQIICRQPFRRDVQFGLSFIQIKSVTIKEDVNIATDKNKSDGKKGNDVPHKNIEKIQKHFFGKSESKR